MKTLKPKKPEAIKDNKSDDNEKLLKYKNIFDELSNERIGAMYNISKKTDFKNLVYYFKSKDMTSIHLTGLEVQCYI